MTAPVLPDVEKVYATGVPGLVLWRFPRRTLRMRRSFPPFAHQPPDSVRSRYYSVTHERSGYALLPGGNGTVRAILRKAEAMRIARALGDLHYRRKPVDWTLPFEELMKVERIRMACTAAAGWVFLTVGRNPDKELRAWGERHRISVDWELYQRHKDEGHADDRD